MLITNTGRVEQRIVDVGGDAGEALLGELRARAQRRGGGPSADRGGPAAVGGLPEAVPAPRTGRWSRAVLEALEDSLDVEREERIVLAGTANLARSGTDFAGVDRPGAGGASRSRSSCSSCCTEMAEDASGVGVLIGRETAHVGLAETRRDRQRLRFPGRGRRPARCARPDPDGLPDHDGGGAGGRPLRLPDPRLMSDRDRLGR